MFYGNEAAMTAASGMALYQGGEAMFYNPAGLGGMHRTKLDITGTAFVLRVRNLSGALEASLPSGLYRPSDRSLEVMSIPGALVFMRGVSERVTLAFGIFVTAADQFSGDFTLSRPETLPGSNLEVLFSQRAMFSLQFQTYRIGPSVGVKLTRRLRVGSSFFLVYSKTRSTLSLLEYAHADAAGAPAIQASSISESKYEVTVLGGQLVTGLQWEATKGLHLGLVVRTPTLSFRQVGKSSLLTAGVQLEPGFTPLSYFDHQLHRPGPATGQLVEPAVLSLGLAYRHRRFWIGAEADLQLPLTNEALLLDYAFQWDVRVGGRFWVKPRVSVGLGAFTDRSPKHAVANVGDYVVDYYGLAMGVEWRSVYRVHGRPLREGLVFSTTLGLRYAYGAGRLMGYHYNFPWQDPSDSYFITPRVSFHDLALHIGSALLF